MATPEKLKELEDIVIDFNGYLETVSVGLKHLKTGVQAIVDNIRTEIEELSNGTADVIGDMKKDLAHGRTVMNSVIR